LKNPFKTNSTTQTKNKHTSKSEEKTCLICRGIFDERDGISWKRVWFCKKCFDSLNFKNNENCIRLSKNEILIQCIYSNGLCPIPSTILERLEKSPDFSPMVKRSKYYAIDRILAYLRIEIAHKKRMTKWVYEGTKEIHDDFDGGYTAQISLEYNDENLRKFLGGILRDHGFGCLVSEFSVMGHKNNESPNEDEMDNLIKSIITAINERSLEYDEPNWSNQE
jgi:hypothetical protein